MEINKKRKSKSDPKEPKSNEPIEKKSKSKELKVPTKKPTTNHRMKPIDIEGSYNRPLNLQEFNYLNKFVQNPTSWNNVKKWLEEFTEDNIAFIPCPQEYVIQRYISCQLHCSEWLNKMFREIGWIENKSGLNPMDLGNCVSELLTASLACFKLACKQMMRFHEFSCPPNLGSQPISSSSTVL